MTGVSYYNPPVEFHGWWIWATVDGDKLKCRLWGDRPPKPEPNKTVLETSPIYFEVFFRGEIPYCEVTLFPALLELTPDKWLPAGALERCVAWAWVDNREARLSL